jgi:hypothetical protein
MLEQGRHCRVLGAAEGAIMLADHDGVKAALWVGHGRQQRCGLRTAAPREHPALPGIEVFSHDPPMPSDQRPSRVPLPGPRHDRVLVILSGHPPVEREPQAARARRRNLALAGTLGPLQQTILSHARASRQNWIW